MVSARVFHLCDRGLIPEICSKLSCLIIISPQSHVRRSVLSSAAISFCSNTGSIRDDPYWTSRENSLELIELSSVNKVSLV